MVSLEYYMYVSLLHNQINAGLAGVNNCAGVIFDFQKNFYETNVYGLREIHYSGIYLYYLM